jgi:hypothetical protein
VSINDRPNAHHIFSERLATLCCSLDVCLLQIEVFIECSMLSLPNYHTVDSATSEEIESSLSGQMGVVSTKRRCFGASTEMVVSDETSNAPI